MAGPDDTAPVGDDDFDHADLQAALGDLLAGGDAAGAGVRGPGGEPADLGGEELDLSMLEDAVAELGIEVGNDEAVGTNEGDEPGAPRRIDLGTDAEERTARPNPGLDLTELPPPPGAATPPVGRKLPPLGQASAADLFGDEDWDDGDDVDAGDFSFGEDDGPADLPPPPDPAFDEPQPTQDTDDDPVQLPAPDAPRVEATTDEVIAFAAHKGRLSGEIASKAKKLFGR